MRTDELKKIYGLEKHPEGGWFSEVYTSDEKKEGRSLAGSICFLLDKNEISHFHVIDCDELWYYHEGCGLVIHVLTPEGAVSIPLGNDLSKGERAVALVPKGCAFAAENSDKSGYTFISCATAPKFRYEGFRLLTEEELLSLYPDVPKELLRFAAPSCG